MKSATWNLRHGRSAEKFPIAFVGTYPPRRCGIATFTCDLATAVAGADAAIRPVILAMDDADSQHDYPKSVRFAIRQGIRGDYARAADFVNYSDVRLVSIQHEYGIYGDHDGAHILDFAARLRKPIVTTLHTVLKAPTDSQRSIIRKLAERGSRFVVMSDLATELLKDTYGVSPEIICTIPHGIPDLPLEEHDSHKARFGVAGRPMLLSFGLLNENKGIETVISALPRLIPMFPDLVYFVVGATHPDVKRRQGEAYRNSLHRLAENLDVSDNVVFRNQFVEHEELCEYLLAADIYIIPYLNEAQITSGTLAYAMGSGTAVVSTPFWHAQELLSEGRGRFFGFGDSGELSAVLESLLSDEAELRRAQRVAYEYARGMTWPRTGEAYLKLFRSVVSDAITPQPIPRPHRIKSLPELRLDHLLRMTDDTGLLQHATYSIPNRRHGYCVDDNARGLLVALLAHRITNSSDTKRLVTTYLSYLHYSQLDDGRFYNFMDYSHQLEEKPASEDCTGRALWALGTAVQHAPEETFCTFAREMFLKSMNRRLEFGPRGSALSILGLAAYLEAEPDDTTARAKIAELARDLVARYEKEADDEWRWYEPILHYDNALLPLALFKAHEVAPDETMLRIACESLGFLEKVCFPSGQLELIGNMGWYPRGGARAVTDEQPIDATAFVLAFRDAYLATHDDHYLRRMRNSFDWFLGANRLGRSLYDFSTAGCHDGIGEYGVNQNQGAESTVSFLMALLAVLDLAGEGLDDSGKEEFDGNAHTPRRSTADHLA